MNKALALAAAALLVALPAHADTDWSIGLKIGVGFVDNSTFVATDEVSDVVPRVGTEIQVTQNGPRWFLNVDYDIERRFYLRETQRDRTRSYGNIDAIWDQVPDRLRWSLSHSQRQLKRDAGGGLIESNIEDRSVTSFGPTLSYALTPVDIVSFSPNVTAADLREENENDSLRYSSVLSWQHRLSPIDSFTVSGSYVDVDFFSDDKRDDYDAANFTVGYDAQLSDIEWLFYYGRGSVNRANNLSFNSTSVNAQIQYRSGPQALSVAARSFVSDTSIGDSNQRVGVLSVDDLGNLSIDILDLQSEPDIVERTTYEFAYINEAPCNRCTIVISGEWLERDFKTQNRRTTERRFNARMNYSLTEDSTVSLTYEPRFTRQEPAAGSQNPTRESKFHTYRLGYSNTWLRDAVFSTGLIYEKRNTIERWELNLGLNYRIR